MEPSVGTPLLLHDPRALGPWTVHSRLGSGGMGVVYFASHEGKSAAIKVIRPGLLDAPATRDRFRREVEIMRRVRDVHICHYVDADLDSEPAWLALEYLSGPLLRDRVTSQGPMPEDDWWELAEGLAQALTVLEIHRVTHRDLKPGNVILNERGPVLIDFGIAHPEDATALTATGLVTGSPAWLSPEQANLEPVGPAADVFTLGSVLAFAATGRPPFGEGASIAVLTAIATREPDLTGIDPGREQLLRRMLAKEPASRPTARAVLDLARDRYGGVPAPSGAAGPAAAAQAAPSPGTSPPASLPPTGPTPGAADGPSPASPPTAGPSPAGPSPAGPSPAGPSPAGQSPPGDATLQIPAAGAPAASAPQDTKPGQPPPTPAVSMSPGAAGGPPAASQRPAAPAPSPPAAVPPGIGAGPTSPGPARGSGHPPTPGAAAQPSGPASRRRISRVWLLVAVLAVIVAALVWALISRGTFSDPASTGASQSESGQSEGEIPASAADAPAAPGSDQLRSGDWVLESYRFVNEGSRLDLTGTVRNDGDQAASATLRVWVYQAGQALGSVTTEVSAVPANDTVPVVMSGDAVWRGGDKVVLLEAS